MLLEAGHPSSPPPTFSLCLCAAVEYAFDPFPADGSRRDRICRNIEAAQLKRQGLR
jgi:hypothetical protein